MDGLELTRPLPSSAPAVEIDYPVTDDQPMPDGDYQAEDYIYGRCALRSHYRDHPQVYVSGDLFVYYREGDPTAVVAPDVFVSFGVEKRFRDTYKVWEEGVIPSFVLEIVSPSTHRTDVGEKKWLYASLGVGEYWMFDPRGRYLTPMLQGYGLRGGRYVPIVGSGQAGADALVLRSAVLGLDVCAEEGRLRFFDPERGEYLRTYEESEAELRESQAELEVEGAARRREQAARAAAEARVAELEARLRVLSGT